MKIKKQKTKSLQVRSNFRSSDGIAPNFIYGCVGSCTYCYAKRNPRFRSNFYINENTDQILGIINDWSEKQPWPKKPNQVHDKLYGLDIGCSTDVALQWKHQDWSYILAKMARNEKIFATFATKHVNYDLLNHSYGKHRIRFSLMPQKISSILEPKMSPIIKRIEAIDAFKRHGWDVHINFSPIVAYKGVFNDYEELFKIINEIVTDKDNIKCECIFLTHSAGLHEHNVKLGKLESENMIWLPKFQEKKQSQYKSFDQVFRYERKVKKK